MSEIRDLYQEVILDHSKTPRNRRVIQDAHRRAVGDNPLCGDRLTIYLKIEDDRVQDVSFEGQGCAISQASASVMTEELTGKTLDEIEPLFDTFHELVTGERDPEASLDELGKMAVFSGVSKYPARVKCAILAWHTLKAALEGADEPVSTEE